MGYLGVGFVIEDNILVSSFRVLRQGISHPDLDIESLYIERREDLKSQFYLIDSIIHVNPSEDIVFFKIKTDKDIPSLQISNSWKCRYLIYPQFMKEDTINLISLRKKSNKGYRQSMRNKLPIDSIGAPIVDDSGDVIGVHVGSSFFKRNELIFFQSNPPLVSLKRIYKSISHHPFKKEINSLYDWIQDISKQKMDFDRDIIEKVNRSVFIVSSTIKNYMGTGYILPGNILATNFHVLEGLIFDSNTEIDSLYIRHQDGRRFPVNSIVDSDVDNDIVLLKIEIDEDLPSLNLGKIPQKNERDFLMVGYPNGLHSLIHLELIKIHRGLYLFHDLLQQVCPGASGSPILNCKGEIISMISTRTAVIFSKMPQYPFKLMGIRLDKLQNMMKATRIPNHPHISDNLFEWIRSQREIKKSDDFLSY